MKGHNDSGAPIVKGANPDYIKGGCTRYIKAIGADKLDENIRIALEQAFFNGAYCASSSIKGFVISADTALHRLEQIFEEIGIYSKHAAEERDARDASNDA